MPQLHCYVPENVAASIQHKAQEQGLSVSRWLAELIRRDIASGWPQDFFTEVAGSWQGKPLQRAPQGPLEARDEIS